MEVNSIFKWCHMKYSVEMYIPKNSENYVGMVDRLKASERFEFTSITDGTNSSSTEEFLRFIKEYQDLSNVCLHIAYMTRGRESVLRLLDWVKNETTIRKLFLVRGNPNSVDYSSICDIIDDIGYRYGSYFTLMSSFYPDGFDGYSIESSIDYSILKIANGCEYLISQYTTNYDNLYRFRYHLDQCGLGSCLIPSVLPILDTKAVRVVESITKSQYLGGVPSEDQAVHDLNLNIKKLQNIGFNHIHIFTLNHIRFLSKLGV